MCSISILVKDYLDFCAFQKKLSDKTIKAYSIDLLQFVAAVQGEEDPFIKSVFSSYITNLHRQFKPRSAKRKIASLKAFMGYLEFEELILRNPFDKIKVKFQQPILLPRTIPSKVIQQIFVTAYQYKESLPVSSIRYGMALRDIAVLEMLFATGARVSELCSLRPENVNLSEGEIRFYGKGAKERVVQIENQDVLQALIDYKSNFEESIKNVNCFFLNRNGKPFSEQSVRNMICRYANQVVPDQHITPHMFRHSVATLLLDEGVDIRYIQAFLGHSSIVTTQIYTHVAAQKQRAILSAKHPRNMMSL